MGFWTKLSGIGMAAAGVGLMATGVGGPAGAALIGGGMSVIGGDVKKDAAKKAATQEQAAIDKAIDTTKQARDEATALYSPYTSTGSNAMDMMSHYMGFPAPTLGAPAATKAGVTLPMATPVPTATPEMTVARPRNPAGAATPQTQAIQQNASGYQPTLGGTAGGGLVHLQSPTGQSRMVPREAVSYYVDRGATIIGGAA